RCRGHRWVSLVLTGRAKSALSAWFPVERYHRDILFMDWYSSISKNGKAIRRSDVSQIKNCVASKNYVKAGHNGRKSFEELPRWSRGCAIGLFGVARCDRSRGA